MKTRLKMLNATKWAGSITFITGIMIFLYGIITEFSPVMGIGIGTIIGGVIFFLMGIFFIATEEMVENTSKGIEIPPANSKNSLYLVKK